MDSSIENDNVLLMLYQNTYDFLSERTHFQQNIMFVCFAEERKSDIWKTMRENKR